MHRLPALTALTAIAALTLAGCSGAGDDTTQASAPTDSTLHLAFLGGIGQPPDPDVFYGGNGLNIMNNVYEGLVRQTLGTDESTIEPWIATDWSANDDSTEWTFHLTEGVLFHDGTELTSEDVKVSTERRQEVGGDGAGYMVADVTEVETPDDYTVVFHLASSNASFATIMASSFGLRIESSECLETNAGSDNAQTYLQTHDCGSGPYTLESADDAVGYTLQYFDDWHGDEPVFTTIEYSVEQNASAIQLKFDSGDLDIIQEGLTGLAYNEYKEKDGVDSYTLPVLKTNQMRINETRAPFDDEEFRQAFRAYIDSETFNDSIWQGNATVATTIYGLGFLEGTDADSQVTYDPSQLESIVDSLSADERKIQIGYRATDDLNSQLVNTLAASLTEIGFEPEIVSAPTGAEWDWAENPSTGPNVFFAQSYPDGHDPYLWAQLYWPTDGSLNTFGTDYGIDDLLDEALATGDADLYRQVGEAVDDNGGFTNLVYLSDYMVSQSWVTGIEEAHDITAPGYLDFTRLGISE